MMRLDKLLANKAFGSRKEVHQIIKDGRVTVNGTVILKKDQSIHIDDDIIAVDGVQISTKQQYYIKFHKPAGYITAVEDPTHPVVMDLLPPEFKKMGVFPVGRLDKDTEGLLVLTNDGQLAHRVLSPKKHVPKTYYAKIEGRVTEEDIKAFEAGVTLDDGYETMPAQLKILESGEQSEIELTIHEGKFHQVKRMFESVGKKVVYLKRLSMGKLILDENLSLGEYRELTDEEVKLIEER